MFRCLLRAIAAAVRPKALLIADNVPSGNSCWSCADAKHFSLNCRRRACRKEESHEKQ